MSTSLANLSGISSAIGTAEGYGVSNAIPTLANNPGDLEEGDVGYGTMGQGITVFPSAQAGSNALTNFLNNIFSGGNPNYSPSQTISQFADTYVNGPNGGTTAGSQAWANNVAGSLGVPANTPIGQAVQGQGGGSAEAYSLAVSGIGGGIGAPNPVTGQPSLTANESPLTPGSTSQGHTLSDYVAIFGGMILIAGGIFMFKQTSVVIQSVGGVARAGARVVGTLAA